MNEVRPIHISGYSRTHNDFYPTPPWVTATLLHHVKLRGPVWEPCCGNGAIARVIESHGAQVHATDLIDHGFGQHGVDFFACREFPAGCQAMVTNPPYGDGGVMSRGTKASKAMLGFVRHALELTERAHGQLALLVRFQWIAGKRASDLIASAPLDAVIALTRRITWFDMGEKTNQGQHHHAWLFWDCARDANTPPRIVFAGSPIAVPPIRSKKRRLSPGRVPGSDTAVA
jgi:hypothetical protein